MSYREVRVFEVREVLRLWLRGEGLRAIERMAQLDRKTVRRYVKAATELGLVRDGGEEQLTDELMGAVVEVVRPHRSDGHGEAWRSLVANHDQVKAWLDDDVSAVKVCRLLARRGVAVPTRTVQRYAAEVCGVGRTPRSTVPVVDGEPGDECQVDFGRLGLVADSATGRRRVCHALVFTACVSRHCFVWLRSPRRPKP
jgi:transposase